MHAWGALQPSCPVSVLQSRKHHPAPPFKTGVMQCWMQARECSCIRSQQGPHQSLQPLVGPRVAHVHSMHLCRLTDPWNASAAQLKVLCCLQSFIADDGCLHVVAERSQIQSALGSLDLAKARLLTRLCLFWVRRVK